MEVMENITNQGFILKSTRIMACDRVYFVSVVTISTQRGKTELLCLEDPESVLGPCGYPKILGTRGHPTILGTDSLLGKTYERIHFEEIGEFLTRMAMTNDQQSALEMAGRPSYEKHISENTHFS